jgi:hypothetical protein
VTAAPTHGWLSIIEIIEVAIHLLPMTAKLTTSSTRRHRIHLALVAIDGVLAFPLVSCCNPLSMSLRDLIKFMQTGFRTVGVLSDYEVIVTGNAGLGSGQYSATLDPKIIVYPSFPDASTYSIVFSPNVGGSAGSAVPEPSTWAMMIVGFVGLGFIGWQRGRGRWATV